MTTKTCPNCREPFKIIEDCPICEKGCCSSCSIDKTCISCYSKENAKREINLYFKEKYKSVKA